MPVTEHAFLGIHPLCPRGDDEAGPISGRGIIGIVQRFGTEIDLGKSGGVLGRRAKMKGALTNAQ
jgi:hypothetical protein